MTIEEVRQAISELENGENYVSVIDSEIARIGELNESSTARITELEMLNQNLEAEIQQQKARNYDLLMQVSGEPVDSMDNNDDIEDDSMLEIFEEGDE